MRSLRGLGRGRYSRGRLALRALRKSRRKLRQLVRRLRHQFGLEPLELSALVCLAAPSSSEPTAAHLPPRTEQRPNAAVVDFEPLSFSSLSKTTDRNELLARRLVLSPAERKKAKRRANLDALLAPSLTRRATKAPDRST